MDTTMQEIERILLNNLGNRLTHELIIGLYSSIAQQVQAEIAAQLSRRAKDVPEDGESHG